MSLVGNLEDLGLGDILQIVSLSRKSGELILRGPNREGRIVFKNGQVNRAVSTDFRENIGDLLVRRGIVSIDVIKQAAELQRTSCSTQRLGTILTERHGIDKEVIDTLVKEQIEKIVYSFFTWNEGTFVFDLGDTDEIAATSFDPLQFMLDQGLNPQWLAMEGSRILDERRHRGESLDMVGDEPILDVASLFAPVAAPSDPDAPSPVTLPERGTSRRAADSGTFNLGAELRLELGEDASEQGGDKAPATPGLHLLRGMLQELNNPTLGGGIILLVLRFASELMNRAVIFLVKEDEIVGLGQFGIDAIAGLSADERVRRMRVPRNAGSVFEQVLQSWSALKTVTGSGQWDRYLVEELGSGVATEIFLGPIISEGKVVAILYGDNAPDKRAIGDTESLEIFLSQAGLAMEKALLERRLRSKEMLV
ncbi:MAG: DUF4388 domain-containing protein [Desulfuromonadales bacterium]|nr:DUF4388 domain-containing protein [Desulfuromonadales bacterium]